MYKTKHYVLVATAFQVSSCVSPRLHPRRVFQSCGRVGTLELLQIGQKPQEILGYTMLNPVSV